MRRLLLLILLLTAVARAETAPAESALTPAEGAAVEAVLAALAAGDAAGLATLAARDDPDPFAVADALCARGLHDEAAAFARATPRPDTEALPAYVEGRRGKSPDPRARQALRAVIAAFAAGNPPAMLAAARGAEHGGDDLTAARLKGALATAMQLCGEVDGIAEAYRQAAVAAESIGWISRAAGAWTNAGVCEEIADRPAAALDAFERARALWIRRGDEAMAAQHLCFIGAARHRRGESEEGLATALRGLAEAERAAVVERVAESRSIVAELRAERGEYDEAIRAGEKAVGEYLATEDRAKAAFAARQVARWHEARGDLPEALRWQQKAVDWFDALGDAPASVQGLIEICHLHYVRGETTTALALATKALALAETLGDRGPGARAAALAAVAAARGRLGERDSARVAAREALRLVEGLGDRRFLAEILVRVAGCESALGEDGAAVTMLSRARAIAEAAGDARTESVALRDLAEVRSRRGEMAEAIPLAERAVALVVGRPEWEASARRVLGRVLARAGDTARARARLEEALRIFERLGHRIEAAATADAIGSVLFESGALTEARAAKERAREIYAASGDRRNEAVVRAGLAVLFLRLGDATRAEATLRESLSVLEAAGPGLAPQVGEVLRNLALVLAIAGDHEEAGRLVDRAMRLAEEDRDVLSAVAALDARACVDSRRGDDAAALSACRRAIETLGTLSRGLPDEASAATRGRIPDLFANTVLIAARLGDVAGAVWAIEAGRAWAFLDGLRVRDRLAEHDLPPSLAAAERDARAREATAAAAVRRAAASGERVALRAAWKECDDAREGVREVVERIQREEKAAAAVGWPAPSGLADIAARLRDGEAYVAFSRAPDAPGNSPMALVVTRAGAWLTGLGPQQAIDAACAELGNCPADADPTAAVADLRRLVVAPLPLAGVRRVLVSPDGPLSFAPLALLFPDHEVCGVPSATVYGFLRDRAGPRGEGVLALGDPAYAPGTSFPRLPASGREARAVGDVALTGEQATERGLREALAKRSRWRAVHLACHGLIDAVRPTLSALALAPEGDDDGLLTALDAFRLRMPADLVVLSACETGRGRVFRAEGIVGLTRAFMHAGAPRVLVSLWKVDDEATAALMARFYGALAAGEPEVRALRTAQEHVRSQSRWSHPAYWAAWVLWGLPD